MAGELLGHRQGHLGPSQVADERMAVGVEVCVEAIKAGDNNALKQYVSWSRAGQVQFVGPIQPYLDTTNLLARKKETYRRGDRITPAKDLLVFAVELCSHGFEFDVHLALSVNAGLKMQRVSGPIHRRESPVLITLAR